MNLCNEAERKRKKREHKPMHDQKGGQMASCGNPFVDRGTSMRMLDRVLVRVVDGDSPSLPGLAISIYLCVMDELALLSRFLHS